MRPTFSLSLLSTVALLATSAQAQVRPLPDAPKEFFVEVPGSMEFTGEMIARPLQPQDAEQYGLTDGEIHGRREAALGLLAGYEQVRHFPEVDEFVIRVPEGSENEVATALMATRNFQYVEPNWEVWPIACPNDPLLGSQWHHNANRMNSCAGWNLHTGNNTTVVAICDTGVRTTHQDLLLNRKEGYNAVNQLWESQGGQINDLNGHGTITTGCAAANGNNGVGVSGTGWNLGHRMMRVSNSSGGSSSIAVLTHAARTAADVGDRVASVSYSGVKSSGVDTAGAYCRSKGALLVWAAGNEGQNLTGNRDDNVIVVGATTPTDGKAGFSNFGPFVDLMAPGESIFSTANNSNSSYGSASGTSFSCPLTAGLCGLIFSMDPTLTPAEAETILRSGCDDLGTGGVDNTYGYGRIDVFNSLSLVGGSTPDLLFSDGFESGDFAAGGWAIKGPINSKIMSAAARTGAWGARLRNKGWCEKSLSTATYEDITVQISWRGANYDAGEMFIFEWWNGAVWTTVATRDGSNAWQDDSFVLPAGANNNAAFKIRFRSDGSERIERGDLDNVAIYGTKI